MVSISARRGPGKMRRPGHALIISRGRRLPSGLAAIAGIILLLGLFLLVVFGFHRSEGTAGSTDSDLTGTGDAAWQTNSGPMMSFAPTTAPAPPTRDSARKDPLSFTDSDSGSRAGSAASRSTAASRTRAATSSTTRSEAAETAETPEQRASPLGRSTSRVSSAKTSSPAHKPTPKRIPAQSSDADTSGGLGGAVKALVPAL